MGIQKELVLIPTSIYQITELISWREKTEYIKLNYGRTHRMHVFKIILE